MAPIITVADQILWTQRIHKESINAKARNDFSLRNAVSIADVPQKFKPGHVDHFANAELYSKPFDPRNVGWDPKGAAAKEFRRCIKMQTAGPQERHQFPETRLQEMGWPLMPGGPARDRSQPSGSNPADLGLGWLQKDGHGGPSTKVAASKPRLTKEQLDRVIASEAHRPLKKDRNVRERCGAAPYATSFPMAKFTSGSQAGTPTSKLQGSASAPELGARGSATSKPADPHSVKVFVRQERAMGGAMDHSRKFQNRHPANQWYHPLSNSDVATFADEYTKSWGVQLYARAK